MEILEETESNFTLDHVRDTFIYTKEDDDCTMKMVTMFDRG
ncbi:MAG: hypothetical protein UU89_C0026G0018 [Parcubacteria group bacterium GW2011_GWC2_42_11]|nr:MAG: hypothetical protein UU89_C0026G0018 [Parcubacteria group bacterium GW2011_GWC2_42_11]